jgi:hypothetical protein
MPFNAYFVDDGKGVHKHGVGVVTASEVMASTIDDTHNEERGRKLRYALIDFTLTTDLRITPDVIPQIVEVSRKSASFSPGVVVAIIAPNPFAFAMSRIWQTFSGGLGLNASVFETRAEGIAWLRKQLRIDTEPGDVLNEYPSLHENENAP